MAMQNAGRRAIANGMHKRNNFRHASVSGERWEMGHNPPKGRLPEEWCIKLNEDIKDNDVFVIYSYATPIAWSKCDGNLEWVIPNVKYSSTTTNHQSLISVEAAHPGMYR